MIVLDAAPLIAFFTGAPGGAEVRSLITGSDPVGVTVVNLAEVYDVLDRWYGVSEREMRSTIEPLIGDPIGVIAPTPEGARRAGALRARHYRRRTCELSLADCFLLAAVGGGDRLATSDRAVLRVAGVEGLGVIPIPG
ncbi:MAG: type II toxin-antitoxin system VapC family toxin [Gaiellales bacterium]